MSAEEFYRLRDDRTLRTGIDPVYQRKTCLVTSDSLTVQSFAGQVMVLGTLNLLSRWCRSVDMLIPDASLQERLQLAGLRRLHDRALAEMRSADPFGNFAIVSRPAGAYDLALAIGGASSVYPVDYTIDGEGWDLIVGAGSHRFAVGRRSLNPCGPMGAACLGVAQLFKEATGQPENLMVSSIRLSLLDFASVPMGANRSGPELPDTVALGRALMVGVGMIGSSTLYLLRMLPLAGTLMLLDHDVVKIENLNRSTMLGFEMCNRPKAQVGAQYMRRSGAVVEPFVGTYDEYIRAHGRTPNGVDLLLPLANEFGVRRAIENNYPPLTVYATTTMDWGANLGRHIPLKEDCLLCRYPPQVVDPELICGGGTISAPDSDAPVDVALPFTPSFGAAMLVAELLKLQLSGYPFNENFVFVDLKGPLKVVDHSPRLRNAGCVCRNRHVSVFEALNGQTKFARFSGTAAGGG